MKNAIKSSKRKWISLLMAVLFAIGLCPISVFAADEMLMVNGTNIMQAPDYTVVCGSGTAVYDPDKNILTLNEATLNQNIYTLMSDDLTIQLKGENKIDTSGILQGGIDGTAIYVRNHLAVRGDGTTSSILNLVSSKDGIVCQSLEIKEAKLSLEYQGNLTNVATGIAISDGDSALPDSLIENAVISIKEYSFGALNLSKAFETEGTRTLTIRNADIYAEGTEPTVQSDVLLIDHSTIDIRDTGLGNTLGLLYGEQSLKILNGSDVNVSGGGDYPSLCTEFDGEIVIDNSKVTATSDTTNAIWSNGTLTISGNSEVTAEGVSVAIGANNAILIGGSAKVTAASSEDAGIYTPENLTIQGNTDVTVAGYYPGIRSNGTMKIQDSAKVDATSTEDIAIFSNGQITIAGNPNIHAIAKEGLPWIASFHSFGSNPMIIMDDALIPDGYKIGMTEDGMKTSLIPIGDTYLKNDYSNAQKEMEIYFTETPTITTDLEETEVIYNQDESANALTIQAEVNDGGNLSYQWYRNDIDSVEGAVKIDGATETSYIPKTDQLGTIYYYCVVTNTKESANGKNTAEATSKIAMVTVEQKTNPNPDPIIPSPGGESEKPTGNWIYTELGWWYDKGDGSYPANEWKQIEGEWYHFNAGGYMEYGWLFDGEKWFYLNPYANGKNGVMMTGWILDGNNWFYLNPISDGTRGAMQTGWIYGQSHQAWFYLNPVPDGTRGRMFVGWHWIQGRCYYFYPNGSMAAAQMTPDGYWVDASGAWVQS